VADYVPDPVLWGPQTWEQPADLPRAKQLLGKMREVKTKALRKEDGFPVAKINGVIQQAHLEWSLETYAHGQLLLELHLQSN